jgi:hypothetical protein
VFHDVRSMTAPRVTEYLSLTVSVGATYDDDLSVHHYRVNADRTLNHPRLVNRQILFSVGGVPLFHDMGLSYHVGWEGTYVQ